MEELTKEILRTIAAFIFGCLAGGVVVFLLFWLDHIKIRRGGDWIGRGFEDRISEFKIQTLKEKIQ